MGVKEISAEKINSFWKWFSDNHKAFEHSESNEKLVHDLDNRINSLGPFVWEIGPGLVVANQLVISPGGDLNLLPFTKKIISYAKDIPHWEFHYAKPPKRWELIFDFEKHDGKCIQIDASQWKYVLLKYDDGMFEIIIQTHDLHELNSDEKLLASEILLDGILGEEKRMRHICYIDVVKEFEAHYINKQSNMKDLGNHIESLTR